MKSITNISAASILLAGSYPAFAQAPIQDQTKPPQSVSAPGAMPMPRPTGQTGGGIMPMGGQPGGMGMMMNPAMMQEHMQRMEAHMANMETLLRQLVELQQKN
jgi:hypothetical protein